MPQFRLSRSLGAEQVQYRERCRHPGHYVLEECGHQKAQGHLGVVPEDSDEFLRIVVQGYVIGNGIDEFSLLLVSGCVVLRIKGAPRYVELLPSDCDHPVLVRLLEHPVIQSPVAPCIELPLLLPPHLTDLVCRRSPVIQVLLQGCQFVLRGLPDEVPGRLCPGLEVSERHELRLVELDDRLLVLDIFYAEDSPGILLIPDMQDWHEDEVAPSFVAAPGPGAEIAVVLDVEAVFLQHPVHLVIFGPLAVNGVPGIVISRCPLLAVPVLLRK